MASTFDAYYLWLGIPPGLQPPHYYRLLGLSPFEADPQVIENAARLRTHYLNRHVNGPQAQEARRLLKEVDRATTLLLDPSQRTTYDQQLRDEAARRGRPVFAFEAETPRDSAQGLPPHLRNASDGAIPPKSAIPPAAPDRATTFPSSGGPDEYPAAEQMSAGGVHVQAPAFSRRRRVGRGWQISLLVLLMFLPAHGLLMWIGYRIAYYQEQQSSPPTAVRPAETVVERVSPPAAEAWDRWPRYGMVIQRQQAAVWTQAGQWLDWQGPWTIEAWVRRQAGSDFQPIIGLYPGSATPRGGNADPWRGWVLGVYATEPGREEIRLLTGDDTNRLMARFPLPGPRADLEHVCLVCDGRRATICWNGEPVGAIAVKELAQKHPPTASLWVGNSDFLPEPGGLDAHLLGLRVSKSARYQQRFSPAPNWEPDGLTVLLPDFDTNRTNVTRRRVAIDRSPGGHRGDLLGASWIKWDEP